MICPFQNTIIDPVEGPPGHRQAFISHQLLKTGLHLCCCILSKSNDQNFFWPYFSLLNQVFHSVYNRQGLPGSGTCKDKTWFAYNEQEKTKILKELDGKKITIQRSKGLGENAPEMMWMTTMNPEPRRLIKVMPEDAERTAHYFDFLLGDGLQERKNFIAENGAKYLELADIS